jgi:hypothetical protein
MPISLHPTNLSCQCPSLYGLQARSAEPADLVLKRSVAEYTFPSCPQGNETVPAVIRFNRQRLNG